MQAPDFSKVHTEGVLLGYDWKDGTGDGSSSVEIALPAIAPSSYETCLYFLVFVQEGEPFAEITTPGHPADMDGSSAGICVKGWQGPGFGADTLTSSLTVESSRPIYRYSYILLAFRGLAIEAEASSGTTVLPAMTQPWGVCVSALAQDLTGGARTLRVRTADQNEYRPGNLTLLVGYAQAGGMRATFDGWQRTMAGGPSVAVGLSRTPGTQALKDLVPFTPPETPAYASKKL